MAPWPLVPHRNPGGILGLIVSRQEEVLRCESKEMPRKCQMCFSASARGANLSRPPTSRPSQDREWDQVGAPDPLTVCEFQDGGREPEVRSPEGQTSRRHFQAHIPTSSSLSSCPQDSSSGGLLWSSHAHRRTPSKPDVSLTQGTGVRRDWA